MEKDIIESKNYEMVSDNNSNEVIKNNMALFLEQIRPAWKGKSLIKRVMNTLPVDPSSACQRLLNAAFHDLREKVIIAGIDIAKEAAKNYKLPPVESLENIEDYPPAKLLDLCYRMSLISRPDWRRLHRSYEIRRDLEHEDDEYIATFEDCIYIFKTAVEVVLKNDPIEIVKITDVKQLIESPEKVIPTNELNENFSKAPITRQEEICKYLTSQAINSEQADIVRINAIESLRHFEPMIQNQVKINLATILQNYIKKGINSLAIGKTAYACGSLPYFKKSSLIDLFNTVYKRMKNVGTDWKQSVDHEKIFIDLEDIGGIIYCPDEILLDIIKWIVIVYIGERGGYGYWGRHRDIFYSDLAVPIIKRIFSNISKKHLEIIKNLKRDKDIISLLSDKLLSRRYEDLLDNSGDV